MYSHRYFAQAMAEERITELRRSARPRSAKQQLRFPAIGHIGRLIHAVRRAAWIPGRDGSCRPCPTC